MSEAEHRAGHGPPRGRRRASRASISTARPSSMRSRPRCRRSWLSTAPPSSETMRSVPWSSPRPGNAPSAPAPTSTLLDDLGTTWQGRNRAAYARDYIGPLLRMRMPLIIAIRGYCLGGGLEIALVGHPRGRRVGPSSAPRRSSSAGTRVAATPPSCRASSATATPPAGSSPGTISLQPRPNGWAWCRRSSLTPTLTLSRWRWPPASPPTRPSRCSPPSISSACRRARPSSRAWPGRTTSTPTA